jgi:hypothetical protein
MKVLVRLYSRRGTSKTVRTADPTNTVAVASTLDRESKPSDGYIRKNRKEQPEHCAVELVALFENELPRAAKPDDKRREYESEK